MNNLMLKMFVTLKTLMSCEEGQDLVEYALVVALIALGAVAAMQALSTEISTVFGTIKASLAAA
jgi:pilus assembly protein Flp/PilA